MTKEGAAQNNSEKQPTTNKTSYFNPYSKFSCKPVREYKAPVTCFQSQYFHTKNRTGFLLDSREGGIVGVAAGRARRDGD